MIERAAVLQLHDYLDTNSLFAPRQSAYRSLHSCETALLRVYNDLLLSVDRGDEAAVVLLDYSAAFDTISHTILLQRLQNRFGLHGLALDWVKTYFLGRSQSVIVESSESVKTYPKEGVPQGSVFGPLAFSLYVSPLEDVIANHGVSRMVYADDTQTYVVFKRQDAISAVSIIEECLEKVKVWSSCNSLCLNESKTELIHVTSRYRQTTCLNISFNNHKLNTVDRVRNLGVIFDNNLLMVNHISKICQSASLSLYKIGKIGQFLDEGMTVKLVHAFISCHIDYCNILLYMLPDTLS